MIDPKLTTLSEIFADADDAAWNVARELAGPPQPTPHAQSGTNDDEVFEFLIDLDAVPAPGPAPRPMQPADDSRASDEAHTLEHRPIEPLAAPVFTTHDANPAAPLTEVQTEPAPPGPELTPLFPSARRSPAASAYMRKRAALHGDALDALALAVRRIREGLEDEGADFDDAIKAAPILHKHIEHFERLAAGQAQRDGAQMINARFGFDKRGEYFVSLELVQPDDFTDPLHAAE